MYMNERDAQRAVDQAGFGKFNLKVAAIGQFVYLNCAFCITSIGFVVPTAACDFQMTTIDKGRISAAVMLGMVIGTCVWGYFTDLKGRREALLIALFMQFIVDALSSLVPNYWVYVFLKVLSGIGVTGQLSIIFSYLGEFQPSKYREQVLSCMELSWAIGIIIVALLAWAIIPLEFELKLPQFWFSSWNLFVLICSIPSLIIALCLLTLPETPKFLAESGQLDVLLQVLTRMFVENTGQTAEQFRDLLSECSSASLRNLVIQADQITAGKSVDDVIPKSQSDKFADLLNNSKSQVRLLVHKPYAKRLVTCSFIVFCMSSAYFSLMVWFPELFQRFAAFERDFPDESASVCTINQKFKNLNSTEAHTQTSSSDPFGCESSIDYTVYLNSIWLGIACIPCGILLPLTVDRVGYRVYLLFTGITSCAATVGFFYVRTSIQNLVLSCLFEAFTSLNSSVTFCLLVGLFPTNVRVMASAIALFMSRLGALFGSMIFGYLIDHYCTALIIIMAVQLFLATAACWTTPGRDKLKMIQGQLGAELRSKNASS